MANAPPRAGWLDEPLGKPRLFERKSLLAACAVIVVAVATGAVWINDSVSRGRRELDEYRQRVTERRKNNLRNLVDLAYQMVEIQVTEHSNRDGPNGRQRGAAEAIALLRDFRYGGDGYFWVNDLEGRMILHPFQPELEGRNLLAFKDPNGVPLFEKFVKVCKAEGAGFVAYSWPRPGDPTPQPKLSYVRLIPEWGWIVGTGVYIDDIEREVAQRQSQTDRMVRAQALQIVSFTLTVCLVVAVFAVVFERRQTVAAAVRASEEQLRRIIDGAPDGIVIYDAESGEIRRVNVGFARTVGRSPEEFVGALVTRRSRQRIAEALAAGAKPGDQIAFGDDGLRREDGSRVDIEVMGTLLEFAGRKSVAAFVRDITVRKRAEEELRHHEQLLSTVLNNTDNALLVLDANRRAVYYNDRYAETWKFPKSFLDSHPPIEDIIRRACAAGLYPEAAAEEIISRRLQHLQSEEPRQAIDTPRQDGVVLEAYTSRLPGGGYLLAFRDVTAERRAEQALRDQKEFSEDLVRSSAVATFVLAPDHTVLFWNKACEELTGLPAKNLVGTRDHWKAFYPQKRPCLADLVIDRRKGDGPAYYKVFGASTLSPDALHGEGWYQKLGGRDRYIVFDAAPIYSHGGELAAVVETLQDLTGLKRAEGERELLTTAVEQAAEAIVVTDTQGEIQYVNPSFTRITGYERDEAVGRKPSFLKSGKQDEGFYVSLWNALRRGDVWKGRMVNRRKDGALYEEESTISPVRDDGGQIAHYVAVHRDVTAEAELERRVAEAQKLEALGTLAGGIAHDFNNILTAVMGFTELSLDDAPPGGILQQNLKHILTGTERAKDLVRQILAFSRRRQEDDEMQAMALGPMVKETMKFLRASLPSTIDVRWGIDAVHCKVVAAPSHIHQVLLNLCTNAAQAMGHRSGTLEVEVAEEVVGSDLPALAPGRYVRMTVSDTGPGMPPEILSRIFEPFFTTKGVGEGTGMGLAVVHGIVKNLKGEVFARSQVGAGAAFDVYLPAAPDEADLPSGGEADPCPKGNGRILVVDDEADILEVEQRLLEQLGYNVYVGLSSEEALAAIRQTPGGFDLLITDQTMPGMTGVDLVRELRSMGLEIPVILCTGYGPGVSTTLLAELDIRAVLEKPMSRRKLAEAVASALPFRLPGAFGPGGLGVHGAV